MAPAAPSRYAGGDGGWVPPDGGFGWVIATVCMFVMLFAAQSFIDFGIFLIAFIEYYDVDTTIVAMVGAVQMSASGFCCLIWGPAIHRFGSKVSLIVGTCLIGVGYLLSSLMPKVHLLLLTYGVLPGIGFASYYMVAAVHVQFYFEKRRALAVSLMMTGLSIGGFCWPPVSQWLISNYGWRGAVVIQTALHLNLVPLALLLRPPVVRGRHRRNVVLISDTKVTVVVTSPTSESQLAASAANDEREKFDDGSSSPSAVVGAADDVVVRDVNEYRPYDDDNEKSDKKTPAGGESHQYSEKNDNSINEDKVKANAFNASVESTDDVKKTKESHLSRTSAQNNQQQGGGGGGGGEGQCLRMIMLLKVPSFLVYCIAVYFVHQGHLGVLTFLSLRALGIGSTKAWAAFLLSIAAIFNGILRILFGYLGDRFRKRRLYMFGASAFCGGVLTLVSIRFESYGLLAMYAAGWGIVASCYIALQNTIPIDLVGRQNLPLAVACVWFFTGIAYLTSYPLAGVLLDMDPSAKNFCFVQGIPQVIGALLIGLVAYLHYKSRLKQKRDTQDGVTYRSTEGNTDVNIS